MDSIIAEVTSSDFWVGVLLGQCLLIGGIVYLSISVSNRPLAAKNPESPTQDKRR